jgi:hypothetical protein
LRLRRPALTGHIKGETMDKIVLNVAGWLLFLGGIFGMALGMWKVLNGGTPLEYGVLGIGGGAYLLSSAIVCYIYAKIVK